MVVLGLIWFLGVLVMGCILAAHNEKKDSWSGPVWARRTILWPFYLIAIIAEFRIGDPNV